MTISREVHIMLHIIGLSFIYYGCGSNGRGKPFEKEQDSQKDEKSKTGIQMTSEPEEQRMEEPHE